MVRKDRHHVVDPRKRVERATAHLQVCSWEGAGRAVEIWCYSDCFSRRQSRLPGCVLEVGEHALLNALVVVNEGANAVGPGFGGRPIEGDLGVVGIVVRAVHDNDIQCSAPAGCRQLPESLRYLWVHLNSDEHTSRSIVHVPPHVVKQAVARRDGTLWNPSGRTTRLRCRGRTRHPGHPAGGRARVALHFDKSLSRG